MPDGEIWRIATAAQQIVVSKDEDFAALAAAAAEGQPRVVWVRCGNVVNRLLLATFDRVWSEVEVHLAAGAKVVEIR